MNTDLDKLSRSDLEKLRKDVEKAISTLAERERKKAVAAVEKAAAEHGFSLSELTGAAGGRVKRTGSKSPAKYRNPADSSQTWTGKGRRPEWIKKAQTAGKDLSAFEI